ncbi:MULTISPECIES: HNH endonuclease [unclassified Leptospira]|uniref:HNH endonuclease n=1 Tax=unclassified Leptospira TaxID=2633828 RepID=UPI0002BE0EFC|nr:MULTISPECIES: HNH endonuclease signature motif containing protein [unclassified Leptospira]EMJ99124.1 HNH endonuclease domain protein [Leptospira sp. B5-022]MCR1795647.1 HNH endonuclease [Leptospira sp. id769339]
MGLPRYLQNKKQEIWKEIDSGNLSIGTANLFANFFLNSIIRKSHTLLSYQKLDPAYQFLLNIHIKNEEKCYENLTCWQYVTNQVLKDWYRFYEQKKHLDNQYSIIEEDLFIKFNRSRKKNGNREASRDLRIVKIKRRQITWLNKINNAKLEKHREEWHSNPLLYDLKYNRVFQSRCFPGMLSELIFRRDNYTCQICGITRKLAIKNGLYMEVDHIIEWEDGGKTSYSNGQTLCSKCNKAKHHVKKLLRKT